MRFHDFCFGSLQIDDTVYEHNVVVDRGKIRKRDDTNAVLHVTC